MSQENDQNNIRPLRGLDEPAQQDLRVKLVIGEHQIENFNVSGIMRRLVSDNPDVFIQAMAEVTTLLAEAEASLTLRDTAYRTWRASEGLALRSRGTKGEAFIKETIESNPLFVFHKERIAEAEHAISLLSTICSR